MPRLQSYYESEAMNLHPFDRITNKVQDSLDDEVAGQTIEDKEQERALYERELLGRMMGGKLSPRQFEQLAG